MNTEQLPYLTQTNSWKEGMKYEYSPDLYQLTKGQMARLRDCGKLMGKYLETRYPNSEILEFRIDYVVDQSGNLFLTEVQTDDRGLPAVAITRNATGEDPKKCFPGIVESFAQSLQNKTGKPNPTLLITYPDEEKFYYAGFDDVATICFGKQLGPQILVSPRSKISSLLNNKLSLSFNREGIRLITTPDLVWNFSDYPLPDIKCIQPVVNKQLLLDIWQDDDELSKALRFFIPETLPANSDVVLKSMKENWILKPISGRWSRGVTIGEKTDLGSWYLALNNGARKNFVAQRYIKPRLERFNVFYGKRDFRTESQMFARVEGYYVKITSDWITADVLATCTKDFPVHGKRDCIMINGTVV